MSQINMYFLHLFLFSRALAGMAIYSGETQEKAKPSEPVKAYVYLLQGVENYVNTDITR